MPFETQRKFPFDIIFWLVHEQRIMMKNSSQILEDTQKGKQGKLDCVFHQIPRQCGWRGRCFQKWLINLVDGEKNMDRLVKQWEWGLENLRLDNLNVKANILCQSNKLVKETFGIQSPQYKEAKRIFKLNKEERSERDKKMSFARFKRSENCLRLDVDECENRIRKGINEPTWEKKATAIALATGLRPCEILFSVVILGGGNGKIRLKGLLKKRGEEKEFERPLLFMDMKELKMSLEWIREKTREQTLNCAPDSCRVKLLELWKKEIKREFGAQWRVTDLRGAYGYASWKLLSTTESLPCWIHKVLNHSDLSMNAALNYCHILNK